MNKLYMRCLAVALAVPPLAAAADEYDGSKPFICATIDVMECVPMEGCQRVSAGVGESATLRQGRCW